ncbi:MAG: DUF763 domain-containing protein [Thermoplasmata archaeon]
MLRTGVAELPLHEGRAPPWLFKRMVRLAGAISAVIVEEKGCDELLRRISHPYWFQAFSCVLGFDWHSSGTTTVTMGALKEALKREELGVSVVGGKGALSRALPSELEELGRRWGFGEEDVARLTRSSRMCAKVDTSAIQDGHQIYHHTMLVSDKGKWAVVQQGMDESSGYARRYHWLSENVRDFVSDSGEFIAGAIKKRDGEVLDLTAPASEECRKITLDLVAEGPRRLQDMVRVLPDSTRPFGVAGTASKVGLRRAGQAFLEDFGGGAPGRVVTLRMPRGINWDVLRKAYEFRPCNYEDFLGLRGVGPATVRALALISEVVYGAPPSWKDPVKFSFAVGGKDGVPFPVDRAAMDRSTELLREALEAARGIDGRERLDAIRRLRRIVP